ncbi:hypothetical protein [Oceanobacillus alkalisoli]|uniref:hypothetical protein n=1 Tax=Oceanobacillus alkalisoli TaxID=2925113 RepID=UPI001EF12D75|nr:hypothetical protein [Oceanobacillus alkalisoli]MCF3943034.1 hypothetical protein [Oceanobacillus alkalisoli]MCG5104200.1 hypothetical protein [Oceanobacillus alkalisoli]
MKLLFFVLLFGFILFLNLGLYLPSLMSVDEEDIGKNVSRLKKHKWFQELLSDKGFKQLIIHDKDVRKVIGKFNDKKIDKEFFQNRYRKKLENILQQKLNDNLA